MKSQSGFTLIELVVVIVVLGILAAVAIPKFVDLQSSAADAAVKGIAGGLASASALNYAKELTTADGTDTSACNDTVAGDLIDGTTFGADATAGDYHVVVKTAFDTSVTGDTAICTVTDNNHTSSSADFLLIYVD